MRPPDDNSALILPRPLCRFKIKLAERLNESPFKAPHRHSRLTTHTDSAEKMFDYIVKPLDLSILHMLSRLQYYMGTVYVVQDKHIMKNMDITLVLFS